MGPFDPPLDKVLKMLRAPLNPNGEHNSRVLRRWANGADFLDARDVSFIIDFTGMSEAEAASFELPFEYVRETVLPARRRGRTAEAVDEYWLLWRSRRELREAIARNCRERFIVTPRTSKHRVFLWVDPLTLPSDGTVAIASEDDAVFGVLQSSVHEVWSILRGTQLREEESAKRYSHTFTFCTFPFPFALADRASDSPEVAAVAKAARELHRSREAWVNPPDRIQEISARIAEPADVRRLPEAVRQVVRHWTIMAAAAEDPDIGERTITNLYNERPTWLRLAHEKLDRAVLAAYAAVDLEGGWDEDWAEVWAETGAGVPVPADHPLALKRAGVDGQVLANLLRLNQGGN